MPQLNVYKASAGSGKTFRLTAEYLKFLMIQPDAFRHILAVTFTNKATSEMKERILNALFELQQTPSSETPTGLAALLSKELNLPVERLKQQSGLALHLILHDYGRFRIETIDRFFQSLLRHLARELGLGNGLTIDLNNQQVLAAAVDDVIDRSSKNPKLLKWITDYMEERYRDGKSWKIDRALKEFGMTIFKEFFKEKQAVLKEKIEDKAFITGYKKELNALKAEYVETLERCANTFDQLLSTEQVQYDDFSYNRQGVCSYFIKIKEGQYGADIVGKRIQGMMEAPDKWVLKSHPRKAELDALVQAQLHPHLLKTEERRQRIAPYILSCDLCLKHLNKIGLLSDIATSVNQINRDENRFLLSDTNALLKSMISDSDTSFVFEKTGSEIDHILFDEFQDTSNLQWETFRPLLLEGLANGKNSLIVGDVKQSIYRWRNGDWRILNELEQNLRHVPIQSSTLDTNWRSAKQIVTFNNAFFEATIKRYEQEMPSLASAYSDVIQQSSKTEETGFVEITFIPSDRDSDYDTMVLDQLLNRVESLQRKGVRPEQIAILVRFNKHIPRIAAHFSARKQANAPSDVCLDIISDEAFLLASSKALQLLIAAMRHLSQPDDPIILAQLQVAYANDVLNLEIKDEQVQSENLLPKAFTEEITALQHLPIYELAEALCRILQLDQLSDQGGFLHLFMDGLIDFVARNASDLNAFLQYWDETLSEKSFPGGTGLQGIRILSIHKSKGLEFHTVLIPYCDWTMVSNHSDQIWCTPQEAPFNQLELLPIDYGKDMEGSLFRDVYEEETLQMHVDSLNLLYVALTRAEKNMILFCKDSNKKHELKTVSDLLNVHVENELSDGCFVFGSLCVDAAPESKEQPSGLFAQTSDASIPVSYHSYPNATYFKQSTRAKEFCNPSQAHSEYMDRGKLMHKLFSEISHKDDVHRVLDRWQSEGLLTLDQRIEMQQYIQKALDTEGVQGWFDAKHRLYNECSILYRDEHGELTQRRPDRVMIEDHRVLVVDFKFGSTSNAYAKQVRSYMHLMNQMGYNKVEGFLWYVDLGFIESVASLSEPYCV